MCEVSACVCVCTYLQSFLRCGAQAALVLFGLSGSLLRPQVAFCLLPHTARKIYHDVAQSGMQLAKPLPRLVVPVRGRATGRATGLPS